MNDYWTTAVSRFEHDEIIRRARWDSWAKQVIRRRRAERRALREARKEARRRALGRLTPVRSARPSAHGR